MNARKAFPYILLSLLLALAALYLVYYNVVDDQRAAAVSGEIAEELALLLDGAEPIPSTLAQLPPPNESEQLLLQAQSSPQPEAQAPDAAGESAPDAAGQVVPDAAGQVAPDAAGEGAPDAKGEGAAAGQMRALWYGGIPYLGVLSIPALEVTVPVRYLYDFDGLRYCPSRFSGSYQDDDLVIAAHNYDSHFGRIHTLAVGAIVQLKDAEGVVHSYTVSKTELLEPTQLEEMIHSGYDLTLYTCTVGGEQRVTVRCTRSV